MSEGVRGADTTGKKHFSRMRCAVEKPKLKRRCLCWKFFNFSSFVRSSFLLECAVGTIVCDEVMLTLFVCLFVFLLFFSIWLIIVSKSTSERHLWLIIITIIIIVECQECERSGCGLRVHDNARLYVLSWEKSFIWHTCAHAMPFRPRIQHHLYLCDTANEFGLI